MFQQVMASHNARDPDRREAHMLRQLRSLDEWRGHVVHLAMERYFIPALKRGRLITCEELTSQTLALAEKQFRFSEQGRYKESGLTKTAAGDDFLALREHEYCIEIDQADLDRIFEQIRQCYLYLYAREKFLSFLRKGDWYSTEPTLNFRVAGFSVVARLDLVMGYASGSKLLIVDWKIGDSQTSDYSQQLRLYAMAALHRWPNYRVENLCLVEANLLQDKFQKHVVNEDELLKMEDFVYRSCSDIEALIAGNGYDPEDLENYGYAHSPMSCEFCKYQRLCVRLSS
jgi:hypothetical protein